MSSRMLATVTALFLLASAAWAGQRVVILTLSDSIQPASLHYLERGLQAADSSGAELTVIELNTPGGLLTSLRQMTTAITTARRPVAVYVTPSGGQAASAGFFLLMAADVAAMAPGTNAGAAHPVGPEGEELPKTISEKATNDAAALMRSLAGQRNRPVELAEKAVTESTSYTEREALEKKLIDVIAKDRLELFKKLDGTTITRFDGSKLTLKLGSPEPVPLPPSAVDKLLSVIAHPNIAFLLFMAGLIGLGFELTHPGAVAPGVLGGIALLLAFFALSVLPVNYVGVLLILLGIIFFVLEVKVTSYGLLGAAGLTCFVIGSLMLVDSPIPGMGVSLVVILPTALLLGAVVAFLLSRVLRSHRQRPITGVEGMVGEEGEAVSDVGASGKVFVHGEYWEACARQAIAAGERVRVVSVSGKTLEVEAVRGPAVPTGA